jgi:hypothetical protein
VLVDEETVPTVTRATAPPVLDNVPREEMTEAAEVGVDENVDAERWRAEVLQEDN